jgi:Xaa-Pro aminopeptidase
METPQPPLKRGRDHWDQANMPGTEFQDRVRRMRQEMKQNGIEVLLLYGRNTNEYANPCYVSNYITGTQRPAMVILSPNDEIALIFDGFPRGLPTAKSRTWIENVIASSDISKTCVEFLTGKNLINSSIGYAGVNRLMPRGQLKFMKESLAGAKVIDCDKMLAEMRMIKSSMEKGQIQRASSIIMKAFQAVTAKSDGNLNERLLIAKVERIAYKDGAEDVRLLLGRPKDKDWSLRLPEDGQISDGDSLILYMAVESERYWAEAVRTFVVAGDSLVPAKAEIIDKVYTGIISQIKPGKSVSQFIKELMDALKQNQLDYIADYGLGQGVGLSLNELPALTNDNQAQFKDGMCLALRLIVKDKAMGAVMLGNTMYLSKGSAEVLTR